MIAFMTTTINAQDILFQQNFETSPVTNILNNWDDETQLPEGPSPCSKGSRGNTADFNSTGVDFQNAQNSTYFLGVNPKSPCGGYYTATLITDSLDFSAADSIIFKCRYYKTNTIDWGSCFLTITLGNPSIDFVMDTVFSTINNWDTVRVEVPVSIISDKVQMSIVMGGGEGVAIDDMQVLGYNSPISGLSEISNSNILIYPNPTKGIIYLENNLNKKIQSIEIVTINGQIIKSEDVSNLQEQNKIDISNFKCGVYFLTIKFDNNTIETYKFIKQ